MLMCNRFWMQIRTQFFPKRQVEHSGTLFKGVTLSMEAFSHYFSYEPPCARSQNVMRAVMATGQVTFIKQTGSWQSILFGIIHISWNYSYIHLRFETLALCFASFLWLTYNDVNFFFFLLPCRLHLSVAVFINNNHMSAADVITNSLSQRKFWATRPRNNKIKKTTKLMSKWKLLVRKSFLKDDSLWSSVSLF